MKNTPRLAGLSQEIAIHVRKMVAMDYDSRLIYLESLIGPKTTSASEADMRAMLLTRLREMGLWPPR
jgi:hypothetical protein